MVKKIMKIVSSETKRVLVSVAIDLLCVAGVGLPCVYLDVFADPYYRGFFCNDLSIRYPYKNSTVNRYVLIFMSVAIPIITMFGTETLLACMKDTKSTTFIHRKRIPLWIINSYKTIGIFFFGGLCTMLLTNVGKYTIGRLRPHFYEVCQPTINCSALVYSRMYIEDFKCVNHNLKKLREARLSFPSGHASISSYAMIYLALYVQAKFHWDGSYLLKRFIQIACIIAGWFTAHSRVSDYKHHWSDVVAGGIIGSATCLLIVFYVSELFEKRESKESFSDT